MKRALILTAIVGFSCAGGPKEGPEGSFIKLADRGLALFVYWSDGSATSSEKDALELTLGADLGRSYATKVLVERRSGTYGGVTTKDLATFAEKGIDDLLVVEIRPGEPGRFSARVRVISVADGKAVKDIAAPIVGNEADNTERLGRRLWSTVTKAWLDPAAAPPLDRLKIADRLAENDACGYAVPIYRANLSAESVQVDVRTANKNYSHWDRLKKCERHLELERLRAEDARAVFGLEIDLEGVDPRFHDKIRKAVKKSGLKQELSRITNKPALLYIKKGLVVLSVRYHENRYLKHTRATKSRWLKQPAIFLDHWQPSLAALLQAKEILEERVPVRNAKMFLRVRSFSGDYIELGFGGDSSRVIFATTVRSHGEGRDDVLVETSRTQDLRQGVFTLGPPRTLDGQLTIYGAVAEFLGID